MQVHVHILLMYSCLGHIPQSAVDIITPLSSFTHFLCSAFPVGT